MIPVDKIDVPTDRLRHVSAAVVDCIVETLSSGGPALPPIEVCRKPGAAVWTVSDGAHRVTAARKMGVSHIEALVHTNDTLTARTVEMQRNLFTQELSPYDRAKHVAELYFIEKLRRGLQPDDDPRKIGGRPAKYLTELKKELATDLSQVSLPAAIGASVGLKPRDVQRALLMYRLVDPEVARKLQVWGKTLPAAQLMLLGKQPPKVQAAIVERLLIPVDHNDPEIASRRITTVSAGLKTALQKDDRQKTSNQFKSAFARMSLAEKKGALASLALPAGFALLGRTDQGELAAIRLALDAAFTLCMSLLDGGGDFDDDQIKDIAQDIQIAQIVLTKATAGAK